MQVRAARVGDEDAIAAVHVRTWQAAYRGQLPDAYLAGLSVERRAAAWLRILSDSGPSAGRAFVLEDDDRLVGFAHVAPSRDGDAGAGVGELTAIYVAPERWRSGGGAVLLERAVASLREAGFGEATLWVLDTNARARRFYESAGWAPDGAAKVEPRDNFVLHEVRYRRATAP